MFHILTMTSTKQNQIFFQLSTRSQQSQVQGIHLHLFPLFITLSLGPEERRLHIKWIMLEMTDKKDKPTPTKSQTVRILESSDVSLSGLKEAMDGVLRR